MLKNDYFLPTKSVISFVGDTKSQIIKANIAFDLKYYISKIFLATPSHADNICYDVKCESHSE